MKNPYFALVTENQNVAASDHFQDVRLISFDLNDSVIIYSPGDVAMIQPHNSEENFKIFFEVFHHLNQNQRFMIKPNNSETKLPLQWILNMPFTL